MKRQDIIKKLTSRKLWASFANFVSMLLIFFNYNKNEAAQIAALIMEGAGVIGYVIAEGLADSSPSYDLCELKGEILENDKETEG